jgi:hypothetical protein
MLVALGLHDAVTLYKALRHRILSRLDTMSGVSSTVKYVLNEKDYDQIMLINPFQVEIVEGIHSILLPYSFTMCQSGFVLLMSKIMSTVTLEMYARASRRTFTHLGGIKFDGDVRSLLKLFESMNIDAQIIRKYFNKLNRMAYILSMEELNDVVESWNEGHILNLTVGEVKKIVSLRVDFVNNNDLDNIILR